MKLLWSLTLDETFSERYKNATVLMFSSVVFSLLGNIFGVTPFHLKKNEQEQAALELRFAGCHA